MKRLTPALLILSSAALALTASAKVDVYSKGPVDRTATWAEVFKGNNKGQNSDTNTEAKLSQDSLSSGQFGEGFNVPVKSGDGVLQTFVGDGKQLEGIGFTIGPSKEKVSFTLVVVDYGTKQPKQAADIKSGKILFAEKGTLEKGTRTQQYYFDLSKGGDNKLVLPVLAEGNSYGVQINVSGQQGTINFHRSTSAEAYEKGVSAIYVNGNYSLIAVGKKGPTDIRKLNFAIYTAPKN